MSELTIEQKRERIAKWIMKWQTGIQLGKYVYLDPEEDDADASCRCAVVEWTPDTNIIQAMWVAEAMRQKGYGVQLDLRAPANYKYHYHCEVFSYETEWVGSAITLAQAIFSAAVQIAEAMEAGRA